MQRIAWLVLALVHLLPAVALFRPAMIERLYGVAPGTSTFLLLHHRAALFLVILTLCIWAAFDPTIRRVATCGVAISMVSFLFLFWSGGLPNSLRSIAIADLAAMPFLVLVGWKAFSQ